ncbi:MAG: tetratricopeptide repeat protein [Chitinophagaceae bacterium]|nr:tetratricopeptide repeat protein [Chitinophagaceae bacterium]
MKNYFSLLIFLLVCMASCNPKKEGGPLSGMSYAQRDRYFDSIAAVPTRGYLCIDSLNRLNPDILKDKTSVHTALAAFIHSHDRYVASDAKLAFYLEALARARRNGWKELYADLMQQLANYTWITVGDKNKALQHYHNAYLAYKDFSVQQLPDKLNFLFEYAGAYYSFEDYDKALALYNEAVALGDAGSDKGIFISAQNTLALCYRTKGEYVKALDMFNKALASAQKNNDSTWITIVKGNIGTVWHFLNQPDSAKPLLQEELNRGITKNDWKSAASAQLYLAEMELSAGNISGALNGLNEARKYSANTKQEKASKVLKRIFDDLALVYRRSADFRQALLYSDSARIINDSIQQKLGANIFLKAQNEINQATFAAEKDAADRISRYTRNGLVAGLIFLALASLLLITRQRIRHNRKQQKIQAEKERIAGELVTATQELNLFARSLEEKNLLIEKIEQLKTAQQDTEDKYEILSRLEKSVLLTDEQWTEFTGLFEKVHGSFLLRLKEKAPLLSPAEIRIIALGKLKLSNKTMAGMLGITPDAVRMNKFRIRKKLNLEEESEFEKFLASV